MIRIKNLLETAVQTEFSVAAEVTAAAKAATQTSAVIYESHQKYPKPITEIDQMNIYNISQPYLK